MLLIDEAADSIASETTENLEKIEGFDTELANEIILRSKNFYTIY